MANNFAEYLNEHGGVLGQDAPAKQSGSGFKDFMQRKYPNEASQYFQESNSPPQLAQSPSNSGIVDGLKDFGTSISQGIMRIPSAVVGTNDIAAGLLGVDRPYSKLADAGAEATGFQPSQWADSLESNFSPETQRQKSNIALFRQNNPNASLPDLANIYADNPRVVGTAVAESLPSMAAGGALSKSLMAGGLIKNPFVALGAGEGTVMAGQAMNSIDPSVDPQKAAAASLGIGALGGAIGAIGGKLAAKAGFGDIDKLFMGVDSRGTAGRLLNIPGSAAVEGGEEVAQTAAETGLKNLAEDKPFTQNMAQDAFEGGLAGAVMGGVSGARVHKKPSKDNPPPTDSGGINQPSGQPPILPNEQPLPNDPAAKTAAQRLAEIAAQLDEQQGVGQKNAEQAAARETGTGTDSPQIQADGRGIGNSPMAQDAGASGNLRPAGQPRQFNNQPEGGLNDSGDTGTVSGADFGNSAGNGAYQAKIKTGNNRHGEFLGQKDGRKHDVSQARRGKISSATGIDGGTASQAGVGLESGQLKPDRAAGAAEIGSNGQSAESAVQPRGIQEGTGNIENGRFGAATGNSMQEDRSRILRNQDAGNAATREASSTESNQQPRIVDSESGRFGQESGQPSQGLEYQKPEILSQDKNSYLLQQKRQWVADNPAPTNDNFTPSSNAKTKQDIANELKQAKQDYVRQKAKHFKGLPSQYEADLSAAEEAQLNHALTLPFEEYHALVEPDAPKNLSRQGYDALRQERGLGANEPQQLNPETALNDRQDTQAAQPATPEANPEIGESPSLPAATGRNAIGANDSNAGSLRGQQPTSQQQPDNSQPTGSLIEQKKQWVKDNPPPNRDSFAYSSPSLTQPQKLKEFKAAQKAYVTEKAKAFKGYNAQREEVFKGMTAPSTQTDDGSQANPKKISNIDPSTLEINDVFETKNFKVKVLEKVDIDEFKRNAPAIKLQNIAARDNGGWSNIEMPTYSLSYAEFNNRFANNAKLSETAKKDETSASFVPESDEKYGKPVPEVKAEPANPKLEEAKRYLKNKVFHDWENNKIKLRAAKSTLYGALGESEDIDSIVDTLAEQERKAQAEGRSIFDGVEPMPTDKVWQQPKPGRESGDTSSMSGLQFDRMSGRAKNKFLNDDKRMGNSKDAGLWSNSVVRAFKNGEFSLDDKGLSADARNLISRLVKDGGLKAEPAQDALEAKQGLANIKKAKDAARNGNGMDGGELFDLEPNRQSNLFDGKQSKSANAKPSKSQSTKQEIYSLLNDKQKKLADSGTVEIVNAVNDLPDSLKGRGKALFHRVWHGSPSDFERFDYRKVGGMFGSLFGHGLYFSDSKSVAEHYKNAMSGEVVAKNGKVYALDDLQRNGLSEAQELAIRAAMESESSESWLEDAKDFVDSRSYWVGEAVAKKARSLLESGEYKPRFKGKLYEVDLAPKQEDYLDWDKPVFQQSQKVSKALSGVLMDFIADTKGKSFATATGAELYDYLSRQKGSDKAASDYLNSLGIPGLRYKAENSPNSPNNYVIFDDKLANIEAKYSKLAGVEALYDQKADKIYLVAEMLNKDNLQPVAMHELLHRAEAIDPRVKAATQRFEKSLQDSFDGAAKGMGTAIEKKAYRRVMDAGTAQKDRLEEYRAYIVSEYLRQPKSFAGKVLQAIKDFMAAIRMALVRHGADLRLVSKLTPADLFALSKYGYQMNSSDIPNGSGKSLFSSEEPEFKKQYHDIEAKYFNADGSKKPGAMLAPNGKPTNLNKVQWVQVRTKAFKDWFGDWEKEPENASKVVDENGEPLVVYHGTKAIADGFRIQDNEVFFETSFNVFGQGKTEYGIYFSPSIDISTGYGFPANFFLSAKNPLQYEDTLKSQLKQGVDGIYRMRSTKKGIENAYEIAVFHPNQIKSATGNTGEFNSETDDIRYSLAPKKEHNPHTLKEINEMIQTGKMPGEKWTFQDVKDAVATSFVDATRPFDVWARRFPDTVAAGRMVLAKDRQKTRTAMFEKKAMDRFINPLATDINAMSKKHKRPYAVVKEEAGLWMSARYAIEKNGDFLRQDQEAVDAAQAELDADPLSSELKNALEKAKSKQAARLKEVYKPEIVDPTETPLEAGLAGGYNNATAHQLMNDIEAIYGKAALEKMANPVYAMNAWRVRQDLKNGKVTKEVVDKWFNSPHYVPLTGDPTIDEAGDPLFGHGSINQASDKSAKGRTKSLAQNGIDASVEQVQKSARYHGWVDFKDELSGIYLNLVEEKINEGMSQKDAAQSINKEYGIRVRKENASRGIGDNEIVVRKDGESLVFTLNNSEAVNALKSLNVENTPALLDFISRKFTRPYSALVTMAMPLFAPVNGFRGYGENNVNIRFRKVVGYPNLNMAKVGNSALAVGLNPKVLNALLKYNFKKTISPNFAYASYLQEMVDEGAFATIGQHIVSDSKALSDQMESQLAWHKPVTSNFSAWNNAYEMVGPMSVYVALRENGVDAKTAASTSLNLMNFTKKGKHTGFLRALYPFVNATAQGSHQIAMTFGTKKGQAAFVASTLAAMALYSMLRAGHDDDELGVNLLDEISNSVLERHIPFVMKDGTVIKLPVPFGSIQLAWATGVNLVKYQNGAQDGTDTIGEIIKNAIKTIAPVAPAETKVSDKPFEWLMQTLMPPIADPLANIAMDVNSFGSNLTNSRYAKPDVAKSLQGRKNTPEQYKDIAQYMAKKFGLDLYPEQVREVMSGYLVGPFREAVKFWIDNPAKESQGKQYANQLVDRLIAKLDEKSIKERLYYRYREQLDDAKQKESLGKPLTDQEKKMVRLQETIKRMEGRINGKSSSASRFEKIGGNANNGYRKQADLMRQRAQDHLLRNMPF